MLQSVRGGNKLPGEFRKSQNWMGGASLSDAVYIPPQHQLVNSLMGDLDSFLNNDQINSSFGRRSNSALILLNALFQIPVTSINKAAKKCSLSFKAANDLVRVMQEVKMVEELTGQSRNRIFIFKPYLDIFSDSYMTEDRC